MHRVLATLVSLLALSSAATALSVSVGTSLDDLRNAPPLTFTKLATAGATPFLFFVKFSEPVILAEEWLTLSASVVPDKFSVSEVDESTVQVELTPAEVATIFRLRMHSVYVLPVAESDGLTGDVFVEISAP